MAQIQQQQLGSDTVRARVIHGKVLLHRDMETGVEKYAQEGDVIDLSKADFALLNGRKIETYHDGSPMPRLTPTVIKDSPVERAEGAR